MIAVDVPRVTRPPVFDLEPRIGSLTLSEDPESGASPRLSIEEIERVNRFSAGLSQAPSERVTLLGVLLARSDGVSFEMMASILGVTPSNLESFMHGTKTIPSKYENRWLALAEIFRLLVQVIDPVSMEQWISTSMLKLGGLSPLDLLRRGQNARVLALARTYLDPSYA